MYHPLRLIRIAVEAEALRLRHQTSRVVVRVVLAGVAIILLFAALAFMHIAMWYLLRESLTRPHTALALGGADLLLAAVLGIVSARSAPGRVEREARAIRQQAFLDAMRSVTLSALLVRLTGVLLPRLGR